MDLRAVRKFKILIFTIIAIGVSFEASAQIMLGQITTGGLGCKTGSFSTAITDEGAALYFNNYKLETQSSLPTILRTNCTLAIPVKVPANKKLIFESISLTGTTSLGTTATATASLESFLSGNVSQGAQVQEFAGGNAPIDITSNAHQETSCGNDTILRVNSSIILHPDNGYNQVVVNQLNLRYQMGNCQAR